MEVSLVFLVGKTISDYMSRANDNDYTSLSGGSGLTLAGKPPSIFDNGSCLVHGLFFFAKLAS